MVERETLPVRIETENGFTQTGYVTEAEIRALVARIGRPGDRFVILEREPARAEVYIQTWHEGTGPYQVEYRDGGVDRHFVADVADPEAVTAVLVDWARDGERWRTQLDWQRTEIEVPPLPAETREEAEEFVRGLVHGGFAGAEEIAADLTEHFDDQPISLSQARAVVDGLWRERAAEQADWPEVTDADRLLTAFEALDAAGIVARADFTCCRTCGMTEIGGEAPEGARGFVFFHRQDTARAAAGEGLWLAFGALPAAPGDTAAVGREVVTALRAGGLAVAWDGSADTRIQVTPLDWRKRLPMG